MYNIFNALINIKRYKKPTEQKEKESNNGVGGLSSRHFFPFSAPEFLRSAMITSMKGQGKCSQTFRVYTVNRPNRRKMFLFVFVSFVPSKGSNILQKRPTPTDTVIMVKKKKTWTVKKNKTKLYKVLRFNAIFWSKCLPIGKRKIFRIVFAKCFKSLK